MAFGIVEPQFNCCIWRWLLKCCCFGTAAGRFCKGGFRGQLLVFFKRKPRAEPLAFNRAQSVLFCIIFHVLSVTCQKKPNSPNSHLGPHQFDQSSGFSRSHEPFRFDQIWEGTHFFGSEEICDSSVVNTDSSVYNPVVRKLRRTSEDFSSVWHVYQIYMSRVTHWIEGGCCCWV